MWEREVKDSGPSAADIHYVVTGLLDMQRRGVLFASWIDGWTVRIRWSKFSLDREVLTWERAKSLIRDSAKAEPTEGNHHERKEIRSELGSGAHSWAGRTGTDD